MGLRPAIAERLIQADRRKIWLEGLSQQRTQAYVPAADGTQADLTFGKLVGANLREAGLTEANLDDAELYRSDLSSANLRGASLRRAVLRDSSLNFGNLDGADPTRADLGGAHFTATSLNAANLEESVMGFTSLSSLDLGLVRGKRTVVGDWQEKIKKVFDLAGISKGLGNAVSHRLRDTFAVELLQAGVPIERVSVLLGHQSVRAASDLIMDSVVTSRGEFRTSPFTIQ